MARFRAVMSRPDVLTGTIALLGMVGTLFTLSTPLKIAFIFAFVAFATALIRVNIKNERGSEQLLADALAKTDEHHKAHIEKLDRHDEKLTTLVERSATRMAYCYITASRRHETQILTFIAINDTAMPVKELQIQIEDAGAVARYVKDTQSRGEQLTDQGFKSAGKITEFGPLPTFPPHTARDLFQHDIGTRDRWSFNISMQTDTNIFNETSHWVRRADGTWATSQTLSVNEHEKGYVTLWSHISDDFPKDFKIE